MCAISRRKHLCGVFNDDAGDGYRDRRGIFLVRRVGELHIQHQYLRGGRHV